MIKEFVEKFTEKGHLIQAIYTDKHPDNYLEVVTNVIGILADGYGTPDVDKVHEIDDGSYQGTLIYVIGENDYQPDKYWYVKIGYGSCSGCDTLEAIRNYDDTPPKEGQIKDYMTLSLHIIQGLKLMGDSEDF